MAEGASNEKSNLEAEAAAQNAKIEGVLDYLKTLPRKEEVQDVQHIERQKQEQQRRDVKQITELKRQVQEDSPEVDSEKDRKWKEFEEQFKNETDKLGYKIEPGIFDTIVGLNANGIRTRQSCEGHVDWGRITPWVDIESGKMPTQFVGQSEVYQEVAKEEGLSREEVEEAVGDKGYEAWQKAMERMHDLEYTPEFKEWIERNQELAQEAHEVVSEFNDREDSADDDSRITIAEKGFHQVEIYNGGKDYETAEQKRTEKEKQELAKRLEVYRAEFRKFAEFLKQKFLKQE